MNRITLSMPLKTFMNLACGKWESVEALQDALRTVADNEPEGKTKRSVGRPLQAQHPHLSDDDLKKCRDYLFTIHQIRNNPVWAHPETGAKPERLAVSQEDMAPDQIRLDNGVVALLNLDLPDIPPQPCY